MCSIVQAFIESKQCKAQCINNGRYCAPDPEQDFSKGYDGKQVVTENLRQLCVFKVANESSPRRPWKWWDYVTDYQIRCRMKDNNYGPKCAEEVIKSLCKYSTSFRASPATGLKNEKLQKNCSATREPAAVLLCVSQDCSRFFSSEVFHELNSRVLVTAIDVDAVRKCMGDPEADDVNEILKNEQVSQVGGSNRGDVTILPTLVINQRQYRGPWADFLPPFWYQIAYVVSNSLLHLARTIAHTNLHG